MQNQARKPAYVLLAEGFETLEALTIVDVLRRANWPVYTVSITSSTMVTSGQKISVQADMLLKNLPWANELSLLYIPGGMPAAKTLSDNIKVTAYIQECEKADVLIASICAGPLSLENSGLAKRYRGTCYPGIEEKVHYKEFVDDLVVEDGQVITSRGPATSLYFALHLLERLAGTAEMQKIKEGMLLEYVEGKMFGK